MKKIILLLLTAAATTAKAQFLGGFFSQQATQRKIMAEQIVSWQVYLGALKTGYHITQTGLTTAHDLKNGSLNLNSAYFNFLQQVSPAVQDDPKGKACAAVAAQLQQSFTAEISWEQKAALLSAKELTYLQRVAAGVQQESQADLQQLEQVLTPGKLQLATDAERLTQVDKIYRSLQDKKAFAFAFTTRCRKLALARQKAKTDNEQVRKLYGIQQ